METTGTTEETGIEPIDTNNEIELVFTKKGVKQSLSNCFNALRGDEKTKDMFRFNDFNNLIEVQNAWWNRPSKYLSDLDVANVRLYLDVKYELSNKNNIDDAIRTVANMKHYHPVQEKLNSLEWDGIHRIENLFPKYLGSDRCDYTTEATKLFMLGAINRIFHYGCKFDTVICLVEDEQGGGKSTLSRFLAINDEWFSDDMNNLDSENIYRKIQGHWIIEFSEMLATVNAKTVESIKSFLSRQKDNYKIPYDKYPQDIPRQCVFIGTTNKIEFLPKDRTGHRRFIPVPCHYKRAEKHPLEDEQETREYILNCWAEAMEIYRSGEYSLVASEKMKLELEKVQSQHKEEDTNVGIIQDWLDNCVYDAVCTKMIFKEAFPENEYKSPQKWETNEIAEIMNKEIVGWVKFAGNGEGKDPKKRIKGYGLQRAWIREEKCTQKDVPEKCTQDGFTNIDSTIEQMEIPF